MLILNEKQGIHTQTELSMSTNSNKLEAYQAFLKQTLLFLSTKNATKQAFCLNI